MNDGPGQEQEITAPPQGERDKTLNIHQRVQKIKEHIAYIKKDKQVEKYMAVTHDNVTAHTREHFLAYGVNRVVRCPRSVMVDTGRKSNNGNTAWRYEGHFEIDFVNVDKPEERITYELDAHADDFGDKAPGKALSYAVKGAVLKLLDIETGENDEGRIKGNELPLLTEDELTGFKKQIDEAATKDAVTALVTGNIAKQTSACKDKEAHEILRNYAITVIHKKWPSKKKGEE